MTEKTVDLDIRNVPEKMLEDFDKYVVEPFYPGGRSEAMRALIEEELKKRTRRYRFFNGRQFSIPRNCFILFALPRHEYQKLEKWVEKKQ